MQASIDNVTVSFKVIVPPPPRVVLRICGTPMGPYLADVTPGLKTVSITTDAAKAIEFPDAESAEHALKFVRAIHPFNWQVVTV